ncbi:MAG: transcription antitermination factor NusB, partial [Thermomicrobiales bacterium]
MADNNARNTPPNPDDSPANVVPTTPPGKKSRPGKSRGGSSARRSGSRIDRKAPQHQARVLAMQALYEDDLTGHGLDDILQHLGEQERREHGEYYASVRDDSRKAVDEIGFLARNAAPDGDAAVAQRFHDASERVLGDLFATPEPEGEDSDRPDENLLRNRTGVEGTIKAVLVTYRDTASQHLHPLPSVESEDDEEPEEDGLSRLEAKTLRTLETTVASEERSSRETVMDLLGRTVRLARGVVTKREAIDPTIEKAAPAFPIPQLASIGRAVLRIAVYELLFEPQVPFKA